ncbi:MAG: HD domain-containing phosphohydrolase [Myxococcota bacterium]
MDENIDRATVLVVDDERGPRESLRMILSPTHRVLQASSGAEALEILSTEKVDLATLDLNMPGIKGLELMQTIRSDHPSVEIIVITGCGTIESATAGIRHGICDFLQKPFDVVRVSASVTRALARQQARKRLSAFLEELGSLVGRERDAHAILSDVHRSQKLKGRLGGIFEESGSAEGDSLDPLRTLEFLEVLAETIETKDHFMRGHARRVAYYAGLIADRLCLSADDQVRMRIAAFLHDIGKVGVPTDLLMREGALTPPERQVIEQHSAIGSRLLKPLDIPAAVTRAIHHHHEWWDGNGYPDGLSGDEIPIEARIIAICDAFDTMASDRPYRDALGRDAIFAEFKRFAGSQFDPDLVKEFIAILQTGVCDVDPELVADIFSDSEAAAAGDAVAS